MGPTHSVIPGVLFMGQRKNIKGITYMKETGWKGTIINSRFAVNGLLVIITYRRTLNQLPVDGNIY